MGFVYYSKDRGPPAAVAIDNKRRAAIGQLLDGEYRTLLPGTFSDALSTEGKVCWSYTFEWQT